MLTVGILCAAAAYFWAVTRRQQTLVYLLKPATVLLILGLASSGLARTTAPGYAWAVVVALLWSLAGDVFLMLPGVRWFTPGLAAFLVAHLFYIWGLWRLVPRPFTAFDLVTGIALLLIALFFYRRLAAGMAHQGQQAMAWPVAAYTAVLSLMLWRALAPLVQLSGLPVRGALAALGGLLFFASDAALGWDRFVVPLHWREAVVMGTYFAAQYLFALSVAWPPA